jgi:polyphosphate kinase
MLAALIQLHIAELFPGRKVLACSQFRLTRNSSVPAAGDAACLQGALPGELRRRLYGFPLRLEVDAMCPNHLSALLLGQFGLPRERLFVVDGPVNLVHLIELDECRPPAVSNPPVSASETK